MEFEWDPEKAIKNLKKHGVHFEEMTKTQKVSDELRPEYDFDYSKAIRSKYLKRLSEEGANIVVLEPDVANAFSTSTANGALRSLLDFTRSIQRLTSCASGLAKKLHAA